MSSLKPGKATIMGSHYDGKGVNFALFSEHAEQVELCVFDERQKETRYSMLSRDGNIWHGYLSNVGPGLYYNYRVNGPSNFVEGLEFNSNKLLIDPYAKALFGSLIDHEVLYNSQVDNAAYIPKSVVVCDDSYDWQSDCLPRHSWADTIIYEAHVKGLTQLHPKIPKSIRGSYAALGHPLMIAYLQKLGVTAVEILPIQQHSDEPRLQKLGLKDYWGYNVLAPFAVEPRYWSQRSGTTPRSELKDTVKTLHQAGIEVILDVVFNHSAELDDACPTFSLRGIDKKNYYWLNSKGEHENWTGCGNTLKFMKAETIQYVMDCLRYWATEFHVDGFRFDLGAILGRIPQFSSDSSLFCALRQDPILKHLKWITEPWDVGPNGYQIGQFPDPIKEWNDQYRQGIRRFWLFGDIPLGQFAQIFAGSSDLFAHSNRKPSASINFLTCHDGFTLHDLLSFNEKHNEANGEQNHDGNSINWSFNHGVEGNDVPETVFQLRQLRAKQLLMLLFLSQGTPMLLAGDEWGNSQQGNNNSYCQDNEISWLNWAEFDPDLYKYCSQIITIRKQIPALKIDQWWKTDEDVRWLTIEGNPLSAAEWQSCDLQTIQIELSGKFLLVINNSKEAVEFNLSDRQWGCIAGLKKSKDVYSELNFRIQNKKRYWKSLPKTISPLVIQEGKKSYAV